MAGRESDFVATALSRRNTLGFRSGTLTATERRRYNLNMSSKTITSTSMSTSTRRSWRRIAVFVFLGAIAAAAPAEDWNVVRPNNRPYVSFANVAQFYQFPEYTRVSRT